MSIHGHADVLVVEYNPPPRDASGEARNDQLGPSAVLHYFPAVNNSGHTPGHPPGCPGCRNRSLIRCDEKLAEMKFPAAFEKWLQARLTGDRQETSIRYIKESSEETYREYAWALEKRFRNYTLNEIHDGHLRQYQDDRANNRDELWKKKCGQNRIHKEVGLLLRILRAAHLWSDDLEDAFDQLPMQESELQRALSPSEQTHWLDNCLKEPEWQWVHQWSVLSLGTCASTFEVRMGRLVDLNTRLWTFRVGPEASKNKFRNRTIPLEGDEVRAAAEGLLRRAIAFGARRPEDYLLPFGAGSRRGDLDVSRPMTKFGLKDTWNKIRARSGFTWFRPYDMRHTAITRMAERGVPMAVIMAFAGQVSPRMQQHYTTISMQVKRETAQEMMLRKPPMPVHFMPYYQSA